MNRSILKLEEVAGNGTSQSYRTIFKTRHGRVVFLALAIEGGNCCIDECIYIDRINRRKGKGLYGLKPQRLQTFSFKTEDLVSVIAAELDKQFFGVEYVLTETAYLTQEEYIQAWLDKANTKYHFLIMVGEGQAKAGLPRRLKTRLKTKLHRSVYIELSYYKNGQGVVSQCCYYDRQYKREGVQITPPTLISCFFPYTKEGIMALINRELCCDFTHLLVTADIDLENSTTPLCGSI